MNKNQKAYILDWLGAELIENSYLLDKENSRLRRALIRLYRELKNEES